MPCCMCGGQRRAFGSFSFLLWDPEMGLSLTLLPYNTFKKNSLFDPIAQKWYPGEDNTETEGWVMVARQDEQQ